MAFLPAQLGARLFKGAVDEPGAGVVGGSQVGDNDADVALLASGGNKIGKGAGGDIGNGAISHAELIGNLTPEEVVGVVATVEGSDIGRLEVLGVGEAATILLAQYGVLRQQTEADEQVGLAAAYGLLEVKDTLRGNASKPGYALADEILHALGDVGLLEELAAIAFRRDQFVQLLDLVTELDAERIGL